MQALIVGEMGGWALVERLAVEELPGSAMLASSIDAGLLMRCSWLLSSFSSSLLGFLSHTRQTYM